MKYLILKHEDCEDYYCDENRTPMYLTDDWEKIPPTDYDFDVWVLLSDSTFYYITTIERNSKEE